MVKNWLKTTKLAEITKNGLKLIKKQEGARIHVPRELYGARIKIHLRYLIPTGSKKSLWTDGLTQNGDCIVAPRQLKREMKNIRYQ